MEKTDNTRAKGRLFKANCPICEKPVETRDLATDKNYPFCSRKCRLIDLGEWFEGVRCISTPIETEEE